MVEVLLGNDAEPIVPGLLHGIGTHNRDTGSLSGLFLAPVVKIAKGGVEVLTLDGQPVLNVGWDGVEALSGDDSSIGQLPQLITEYLVRGTQLLNQFSGSPGMTCQQVEDHGFSLTADDRKSVIGASIKKLVLSVHCNAPFAILSKINYNARVKSRLG